MPTTVEAGVPLPDSEAREEIFNISLKKEVLGEEVDIKGVVEKTEGFSGAEIVEVCRLAGLKALAEVNFEKVNFIRNDHLLLSIDDVSKNIDKEKDFNISKYSASK